LSSQKQSSLSCLLHQAIVVLANSDLIDKLGVVLFLSIPIRALIVRSLSRGFRFLPEPRSAPVGDPRSPPSTRRFAALRQTTQTDTGGSVVVGLAVPSWDVTWTFRSRRPRTRTPTTLSPQSCGCTRVIANCFEFPIPRPTLLDLERRLDRRRNQRSPVHGELMKIMRRWVVKTPPIEGSLTDVRPVSQRARFPRAPGGVTPCNIVTSPCQVSGGPVSPISFASCCW
jgi:hypothetical protein